MKSDKNILAAFLLNLIFSVFEILGGLVTNSVAILSDAIHDSGDALSIGIAYLFEKKSKKKPNDKYTFGYVRYSILGAFITTLILVSGSILVGYNAIVRLGNPEDIEPGGMIALAIIGVIVNFFAHFFTRKGESLNQKAVNLHLLEDILGWLVVLIGSIVILFTGWVIIDPIMSLAVCVYIVIHAWRNFKTIVDIILEKTPEDVHIEEIKEDLEKFKHVKDVHHIHVWSTDGINVYAMMHVVTDESDTTRLKSSIKEKMLEYGINHTTVEFEDENEDCHDFDCHIDSRRNIHHHHH